MENLDIRLLVSDNNLKYKDIAAKYSVSINTVKSWKTRYGWDRNASATPKKKKPKSGHTKNA